MSWNKYFKALENIYRIKIDNTLKSTIINHFTEELNLYTEQDICEQTTKVIQAYTYRTVRNKE